MDTTTLEKYQASFQTITREGTISGQQELLAAQSADAPPQAAVAPRDSHVLLLLRKGGQIVYSSVRAANRHRPGTPNDG